MNTLDEQIEWFEIGTSTETKAKEDFSSMPFTGLSSFVKNKSGQPIINHVVGANFHQSRMESEQTLGNHQKFVDQKLEIWGESSAYSLDWQDLMKATKMMVSGAMEGDSDKVQQAIQYGADPNTTVSMVNSVNTTKEGKQNYVTVPLGVAILAMGLEHHFQENTKESKEKLAQYKQIAKQLLTHGNTPSIHVGSSPNGSGEALSYQAYGMALEGNNSGADTIETRVVDIPFKLSFELSSLSLDFLSDGKVPEKTSGLVWGEEVPFQYKDSYFNMLDSREESMKNKIERYRQRKDNQEMPSMGKSKIKL